MPTIQKIIKINTFQTLEPSYPNFTPSMEYCIYGDGYLVVLYLLMLYPMVVYPQPYYSCASLISSTLSHSQLQQ